MRHIMPLFVIIATMKKQVLIDLLNISLAPVFVLAVHFLFSYTTDLYTTIWWLDSPMHFMGGTAIGISSIVLFCILINYKLLKIKGAGLPILFALAVTALAATLWEFGEFFIDTVLGNTLQPTVADTMKDMALGLLGGIVGSVATISFAEKK